LRGRIAELAQVVGFRTRDVLRIGWARLPVCSTRRCASGGLHEVSQERSVSTSRSACRNVDVAHVFPVTRKRNFGAANLSGGDENCLKLEGNSMRSRGANQPLKRKFAPQRCRRIRALKVRCNSDRAWPSPFIAISLASSTTSGSKPSRRSVRRSRPNEIRHLFQ